MYRYVIGSIIGILLVLLLLEFNPEHSGTIPVREIRVDTVVKRDTVIRYLPSQRVVERRRDTVTVVFRTADTVTITVVDTFYVIDFYPRPDTTYIDTIRIESVVVTDTGSSFWEKALYIAAGIGTGVLLMLIVR